MALPYFAYGSNLKATRLLERVPRSRVLEVARLDDHQLRCDKRGADGSGKANLHPARGALVWGVLYRLPPDGFQRLDAFEGGYRRIDVQVTLASGGLASATTYRSDRLTDDAVAFDWYRRLILEGAAEHALPDDWIATLHALPWRPAHPGPGSDS